jgi:hypothetical protein
VSFFIYGLRRRMVLLPDRPHAPQPDRLVFAAGGQGLAFRAVRHGEYHARVSPEGGLFLARGHVPQPDRVILAPRGRRPAVGAVGHGAHALFVPAAGGPEVPGQRRHQPRFGRPASLTGPRRSFLPRPDADYKPTPATVRSILRRVD